MHKIGTRSNQSYPSMDADASLEVPQFAGLQFHLHKIMFLYHLELDGIMAEHGPTNDIPAIPKSLLLQAGCLFEAVPWPLFLSNFFNILKLTNYFFPMQRMVKMMCVFS